MFLKYNLPTLLWATVILLLTLLPAASLPVTPAWELISFSTASHAFVFFLLAFLMLRSFTNQNTFSYLYQNAGIATFIISVLFGVMIEILQSTMGLGRQGDIMDVVSNTIGTFMGILIYYLFRQTEVFRQIL